MDDGRRAQLAEILPGHANATSECEVNVNDVREAVKKLKKGKAPGIDGITGEMLKYGGEALVKWITKLCKLCMAEGKVPNDWVRAIVVPFYKGKGERSECKNY